MYNVIIIGGGPAGITAGIYIRRAGFKVLVLSNGKSSLNKTDKIENYYGFEDPISGKELVENGIKQAKKLGIDILNKEVIGIKYTDSIEQKYEIIVANQGKDEKYISDFIVIATGVNRKHPNISGLKEFEGRGVSYCAVCDAAFYRGKDVAVIGSGEYAIGEIEELLPIAKSVAMLTDGEEAIENRNDIEIKKEKIKEIRGNNRVGEIEFKDGSIKNIDGIFIAQGTASSIDLAQKIGARIVNNNNIYVDENMESTIENIYACGDCTGGIFQISKAIYEGTKAGFSIISKLRIKNSKKE